MIIGALWYFDQWYDSPFGGGVARDMMKHQSSEGEMIPAAFVWSAATFGVPAVHIAGMPYHSIFKKGAQLSEYVARTAPTPVWLHPASKFDMTTMKWVLPRAKLSRKMLLRGVAKVGARAVPGLGWALLAVDLYHVGKWYMETDF